MSNDKCAENYSVPPNADLEIRLIEGILAATGWAEEFAFECYGVVIGIRSDVSGLLRQTKKFLPEKQNPCDYAAAEQIISVVLNTAAIAKGAYFNDEEAIRFDELNDTNLEYLGDKILFVLAKLSLPEIFYIHAGAIVFREKTILLPANSFAGKTTLVAEFIKRGAEYATDDLAVVDRHGFLLPFPRPLAVRTENGRLLLPAEHFGGQISEKPRTKVNLVLFTEFSPEAKWQPQEISEGQAVMRLLENFFYKPSIGDAPGEILQGLAEIVAGVEIFAGKRGDAHDLIEWVARRYA